MTYEDVVRCTVYLTSMDDYAVVNEVYARYFSESPPAREAVQVAALPRGARVEISCVGRPLGADSLGVGWRLLHPFQLDADPDL